MTSCPVETFEQYKNLTEEQKQFYLFEKLSKLDTLDTRFASKWVERVMFGFLTLVGVAFAGALINIVINK
jgi:hypothetical protein